MEIKITTWKLSKIIKLKNKIDDQPKYQRGKVWGDKKKRLLIDSMLRGYDIPKIYLRELKNNAHDYEVADGQQRLSAIWEFQEKILELSNYEDRGLDLSRIGSEQIGGKKYDEISKELREHFNQYSLTIAIVKSATRNEIRTLFGRLQEGVNLNPAEKRNAIISKIGTNVDNFAFNHSFFENCRIPVSRFKHQDYMAHVLALVEYNNQYHLKADTLLKLYTDKSAKLTLSQLKKIDKTLGFIEQVDTNCTTRIYKKFHLIDLFWFLYNKIDSIKKFDLVNFCDDFDRFESERLNKQDDPKKILIKEPLSTRDKKLYDYIIAFKSEGALIKSIQIRHDVFNTLFTKYLN